MFDLALLMEDNQKGRVLNLARSNGGLRYYCKSLYFFANFAPLRDQLPFLGL